MTDNDFRFRFVERCLYDRSAVGGAPYAPKEQGVGMTEIFWKRPRMRPAS